jgi:hypothetical protein
MSGLLNGRAFIRHNGNTFRSMDGAKLKPGGIAREPVNTVHGYVGCNERQINAEITCDVVCDVETDLIALNNITGATVTFETSNGATYLIRNASTNGEMEFDSSTSAASITLFGCAAEKS